jgi:hypothetical protein
MSEEKHPATGFVQLFGKSEPAIDYHAMAREKIDRENELAAIRKKTADIEEGRRKAARDEWVQNQLRLENIESAIIEITKAIRVVIAAHSGAEHIPAITDALGKIAGLMTAKRRRFAVRDANGDIIETIETVEDENAR